MGRPIRLPISGRSRTNDMETMNETPQTSLIVRIAVICAVVGLLCALVFLWRGFTPWSMVGVLLGYPLLIAALLLYLIAVARDLRRHGVL